MLTNDIKRIRDKLNVLKNHPEAWGVITDCLQYFDHHINGHSGPSDQYSYFVEELKKKYEDSISRNENKDGKQLKLIYDDKKD